MRGGGPSKSASATLLLVILLVLRSKFSSPPSLWARTPRQNTWLNTPEIWKGDLVFSSPSPCYSPEVFSAVVAVSLPSAGVPLHVIAIAGELLRDIYLKINSLFPHKCAGTFREFHTDIIIDNYYNDILQYSRI